MGIFENCLLASDIDDTLLSSNTVNPVNIEKIEYFMSEGGYFSLATGRSVTAVSIVLDKLKRVSPCVVANGCMIYDYENNKPLHEEYVPESDYFITKFIRATEFSPLTEQKRPINTRFMRNWKQP